MVVFLRRGQDAQACLVLVVWGWLLDECSLRALSKVQGLYPQTPSAFFFYQKDSRHVTIKRITEPEEDHPAWRSPGLKIHLGWDVILLSIIKKCKSRWPELFIIYNFVIWRTWWTFIDINFLKLVSTDKSHMNINETHIIRFVCTSFYHSLPWAFLPRKW